MRRGIGHPVLSALAYNLLNALLTAVSFNGAAIIRSDGPAGFGELALKSLLVWIAMGFFSAGAVASILACRRGKAVMATPRAWTVSVVLLLVALLFAIDACSDSTGHCRHWRFVIS